MEIKQPVYWHQGLFLQPQHFQLTDLHARFRLKPFLETGLPYFWGVGGLEVGAAALAARTFEVQSVSLLLKDGTYLEYPGNVVLKPRSFDTAWTDPNKPFPVYLGLKKVSLSEPNVAVVRELADGANQNVRCVTTHETQEIRDLQSDGPAADVKSLSYVLRVLWAHELADFSDYDIMPVAVLERSGTDLRLAPRFIPPSYALGAAPSLGTLLKEIRDDLTGRARQLEQYKSPRELQKAEFDAKYMVFLLALGVLNRYTPLLYHYLDSPQVHPWEVYGVLRQVIGELSSFTERCDMLGEMNNGAIRLPAYDHADLGGCFYTAQLLIGQLLNEISIGPEFMVPLVPRESFLAADLPRRFFAPHNRFFLVMRSEVDADGFIRAFQTSAKLASLDGLPPLIRRSLPGVGLTHLPVAPQGLPRRAYSFYYRLDTASDLWAQVEREGTLALDWPDAPADLQVELVVVRR